MIVHDHDVASTKLWSQHILDKGLEHITVDGAIHDRRTGHAFDAECSDQCCRFPMTMRCAIDHALSVRCATTQACPVRPGPRLVYEYQSFCVDARLDVAPRFATPRNVRAVLLRCMDCLFLKVKPSRLSARQMADSAH